MGNPGGVNLTVSRRLKASMPDPWQATRNSITKVRTKIRPLRRNLKEAFKKLERKTLDRYKMKFDLGPRISAAPTKESLATAISDHFTCRQIKNEEETVLNFLRALHARKKLSAK